MYKKFKRKLLIIYLKFIYAPYKGRLLNKRIKHNNEYTFKKGTKYFLGLVAIFRGEDDYLVEWIEFHKMMGVEHFILYDNGLEKSSENILEPYVSDGLVTHIPFPDINGLMDGSYANTLSIQQVAYADCINRFSHHFQYLLQIDLDEFIFPKQHNSITDVLSRYDKNKIKGIEVNWTNFGNNGHLRKPSGLILENFTMSAKNIEVSTVKSICNTDYLSKLLRYTNVHQFSYKLSIISLISRLLLGYPKVIKGKTANDLFQLNHYITKSKEEYLRKLYVNKAGYMVGKETEENFIELNTQFNKIKNTEISKFVPKLKSILVNIK